MKTPRLWITIDKYGFADNDFKKLLEYEIDGIRLNTGRCSYAWIYEAIEELYKLNYPLSKILLDIGNTKPRLNLADKSGIDLKNNTAFIISEQMSERVNALLQHHTGFARTADSDKYVVGVFLQTERTGNQADF